MIGLTGGMGMGKSTAARVFRAYGVPVFDADAAVHRLQESGGEAVAAIRLIAPGVVIEGRVDRARLRQAIADHPALLGALERILHPLVRAARERFLGRMRRAGVGVVVLDVPLLFETGGDAACDLVVVVSASSSVQLARVRRRRLMADAEAVRLIARQLPDPERRRRADVVIPTGLSRHESARRIRRLLASLRAGVSLPRSGSRVS